MTYMNICKVYKKLHLQNILAVQAEWYISDHSYVHETTKH